MNYTKTKVASYVGYIVQAIVNNLAPLLYATFTRDFELTVSQLGFLVFFNFAIQLVIDLSSTFFIQKLGYKSSIVLSNFLSSFGLILLAFLPKLMNPFIAIIICIGCSATGSGFIEVLVSPIIEALPSKNKEQEMAILHSFYSWGQLLVVFLSTIFLLFFPSSWALLPILWAIVPFLNAFLFISSPILTLEEHNGPSLSLKELLHNKTFYLCFILILCGGASEVAVAQWASYFAEETLHFTKFMGDLVGPCVFALLMGLGRLFYGFFGSKINLEHFLTYSSFGCSICYLLIGLELHPLLSLICCGLTGLMIAMLWPGIYSLSAKYIPCGGTMMFSFLAFAGDCGCVSGPTLVSMISSSFNIPITRTYLPLLVFPVTFFILSLFLKQKPNREV